MKLTKLLIMVVALVVPSSLRAQDSGQPGPSTSGVSPSSPGGEATSRDAALEATAPTKGQRLPFRGTVSYTNVSSVGHFLNDSWGSTFSYSMAYSFRPRYHFTDWFSLRAGFELEQELTDSGATTYLREPLFSDITLGANFSDILESLTGVVDVGASLGVTLPTSKFSQAATLVMGVNAGLTAYRTFRVLSGLRVSYAFQVTKAFHREPAVELETPVVACTPGSRIACDSLSLSFGGGNNASWLVTNAIGVDFLPVDKLALSVSVTFLNGWSYRNPVVTLEEASRDGAYENGAVAIAPSSEDTRMGASIAYGVEVSYDVLPWLNLALGLATRNAQLNLASDYETPFFNRYSKAYLNMSVSVDAVVEAIRGDVSTSNRLLDEV